MKKPLIGIIGGTGQMGQWFKRFFNSHGYKVLVAGRKTKLRPEGLAKKCDVVVVSVPIDVTVKMVGRIAKYVRKDALLMDLTSIKKEPVKAMLKSKAEVIGAHPVFGPTTKSMKNQTVVLCPVRSRKWILWLKSVLKKGKANIKLTTPEKHDKIMAIIQGVTHFGSLSVVDTMRRSGFKIKQILDFTSPIFRLEFDMAGRILNQDPGLYADIELMNKESLKIINNYINSAKKLQKIIKKGNKKEFVRFFNSAAFFLGKYKEEAMEESDRLIEQMVKRK